VNATDIRMLAPQVRATALWMLLVPILVGAVGAVMLGAPEWRVLALGAGGWITALLLRQPVMLIASRMTSPEWTRTIVGWASGPAEESVRVGLVLLFVKTFGTAVWVGVGWAGAEVVVIAINGIAIAKLMTRDDPKALKVQAALRERDMPTTCAPGWAVTERFSATAMHVGFTLLLFAQPWWALGTIVLHSATNMIAVRYAKRSVALTELALAVFSIGILLCGMAANGRLWS